MPSRIMPPGIYSSILLLKIPLRTPPLATADLFFSDQFRLTHLKRNTKPYPMIYFLKFLYLGNVPFSSLLSVFFSQGIRR
jgi:hypothetical protein